MKDKTKCIVHICFTTTNYIVVLEKKKKFKIISKLIIAKICVLELHATKSLGEYCF